MKKVTKPVIVVTGASQGIGAAIVRTFAVNLRCRIALVSRCRERMEKVVGDCDGSGSEFAVFSCDVTDPGQVVSMAGGVKERWGVPDVLINNAGAFRSGAFVDYSLEDFDLMLNVNLRSLFLVSRAFVADMAAKGRGDIFNMCSIAGKRAHPGGAGYCAAKSGAVGLTRVMREELKEKGIRVTAVLPGPTFTPSWDGSGISEERMMPADDVARAFFDVYQLSRRTVVEEIILQPQLGSL